MGAAILALAAAVGWGTADYLAGRASRRSSSLSVLAVSQAIGFTIATAGWMVLRPPSPSSEQIVYASLSGVFLAIGLGSLYEGMRIGRISLVAPISATAAVVPVVYGLATGEALTLVQCLGVGLALAGVILASTERGPSRSAHVAAGVVFALVAATAGGVNIVFLDAASPGGVLSTLVIQRITIAVLAITAATALSTRVRLPSMILPAIAAIGVVDVVATGCFAAATTRGRLSVVSVLAALYPAVTVILAALLLRERVTRTQRAGIVLALVAVVLLVGARSG